MNKALCAGCTRGGYLFNRQKTVQGFPVVFKAETPDGSDAGNR